MFAIPILKEKPNKNKVIALVLGIVGVLACTELSSATSLESMFYGVISALSFSLYTVLSQKFTKKFGGIVQTSIVFLVGSIILLIALIFLRVDIVPSFSQYTLTILIYLGVFITGIGYVCYFKAIEKGGVIMASLTFFAKPILTPFVALAINGIVPDLKVFVSVICIVVASYYATYKKI